MAGVPSGRKQVAKPAEFLDDGADWPEGPLRPGAPPEAYLAVAVARRLRAIAADRDLTLKRIAERAGTTRGTVARIANGAGWPDMRTLARVECALGVQLWKNEHRNKMPPRKGRPLLFVPVPPKPPPDN